VTSSDHRPEEHARAEILADDDRPDSWVLIVNGVRQSYVDLADPTYLDFEYVQVFAEIVDALDPAPPAKLAVTHVGGGACTLARYVEATRPGSPQIVLEPDTEVTEMMRARTPLPRGSRIRIRAVDGRAGVRELRDGSANVVVLDAFDGGRVPPEVTTLEFVRDVARVLAPDGVFVANVADGLPGVYSRRFAATLRTVFGEVVVIADPAVVKVRRFGNVVLAAGPKGLPVEALRRSAASAPFPRSVLLDYGTTVEPLTDADPMRSPSWPGLTWGGDD
jgi:spermidine synthase